MNKQHQFRFCPQCRSELTEKPAFGRRRQVCSQCGWIHFVDPKVGAGILAEKDNRVLLVRRAVNPGLGLWCLPSGFVEADESPAQAAIRECKEETGLDALITGLLDVYYYQDDDRGSGVLILYRGQISGGEPQPADDVSEVDFFSPEVLPVDIAFLSNRTALTLWRHENLLPTEQDPD